MRLTTLAAAIALAAAASVAPGAGAAGPDDVAGIPAAKVGVHGPVENILDGLALVGHAPMPPGSEPFDGAGNNGGLALVGDCAFVGRWHDYGGAARRPVQIVDIDETSPTFTETVGEVPYPPGVQTTGYTQRELRAVDLPGFRLLAVLTFSDSLTASARHKYNSVRFYTFPSGDCRRPEYAGMFDMAAWRGHEFFLWADPNPAHDVDGHPRVLVYVTAPLTTPNVMVIDASRPSLPLLVAAYDAATPPASPEEPSGTYLGNYAHSISVSDDGRRAYLSYWDAGVLTVDTGDLADGLPAGAIRPLGMQSVPYDYSPPDAGNTHSAVAIPDSSALLVTDEIYASTDGCPFGWARTVNVGTPTTAPHQIGEFRLAENRPESCDASGGLTIRNAAGLPIDGTFSAHNQTVTGRFALVSWYGSGMRVLDLANPAAPVEAGAFVPRPLGTVRTPITWASTAPTYGRTAATDDDWLVNVWSYPIVRNGRIYVTDIRSGLYVLTPTPGSALAEEISSLPFVEGNSNLGTLIPPEE